MQEIVSCLKRSDRMKRLRDLRMEASNSRCKCRNHGNSRIRS